MKVFVFRFNSEMLIDVIRRLNQSFEISYWGGSKKYFDAIVKNPKDFPNTIFHNTYEAVRGIGAKEIDQSKFEPLSKQLIDKMLFCESQTLIMMNAIDFDNAHLSKKKHLYYEYLKYWHGVLTDMKPDVILFGDIPHVPFQFVIYHLAKLLGIKVIMYRVIQVTGRVLFLNDYEKYESLYKELEKNIDQHFVLEDLSPDIQRYYLKQTISSEDPAPFYMKKNYVGSLEKNAKIIPRLSVIFKHIKNATLLATTKAYLQTFFIKKTLASIDGFEYSGFALKHKYREWKRTRDSFKKEYESLQTQVEWNKKFIYVALHNQPECSTSAMGDIFVDQMLMIDILSKAIPEDWVLYIKESPAQWVGPWAHLGRYKGYYQDITKRKNVYLIPTEVSTYELINKAQLVATVTGTVAWEAVLRDKAALIFGFTWFMYCDGIFRVDNVADCRLMIDKINSGYKPDKQKVLNFLGSLDNVSTVAYPNIRFKTDDISEEQNIVNITNQFIKELKF